MKQHIDRSLILAAGLLAALGSTAQTNVAVNATGAAAAPTALLDIASTTSGFLIPRMTAAQRGAIAVGAAQDGLTVYQTDGARGFYYYDGTAAVWTYMYGTGQPWLLTGNTGTNAATNYLGTTDNQPLVFRTGLPVTERMRMTATGNLGINQIAPVERLDIAGAIKQTGTSATNNVGTIRWNAAIGHEGNIDGTATGWRKLENEYLEVFGAAYTQSSTVTCAAGAAIIGPWTTDDTPGPPAPLNGTYQVTPYSHGNGVSAGFIRGRHQYLFRAVELDLEQNQLYGGAWGAGATMGLCAGQPINSVSFYVGAGANKNYIYNVLIKHSLQTNLIGFDNTADPAGQCFSGGAAPVAQPNGTGWITYTFTAPFIWNGVNSIIVEYTLVTTNAYLANPTVWSTTPMAYNCTYYACGNVVGAPGCSGTFNSATCPFTPTGTCSGNATNVNGPSTTRPVIRFNGVTGTAAPAVSGTGKYIMYNGDPAVLGTPVNSPIPISPTGSGGGFMVQVTPPGTWAASAAPYSFKGHGTISAENGVYDNGTLLNDHILDRYFDGRVKPQDAALHGTQRHLDLDQMVNYVERERHLPTMKGREAWKRERGFSLGDLGNQLWATTETQALYLTELNDRLDVLRVLSTGEPLDDAQVELMRGSISAMEGLSETEKDGLIRSCQARIMNTNEQSR